MAPEVVRRVEGQRLVYYARKPDADFWDRHWQKHITPEFFRIAETGDLGPFSKPVAEHIGPGPIVEAGCGLGQLVLGLQHSGRVVVGVEWARGALLAARSRYPDLPVQVGDVTCLGLRDASCAGYLSVGVVEHDHNGPEAFLREARRVLAPDGVAIISVPHFHSLRRWLARRGAYHGEEAGLPFYQNAFTEREFAQLLEACGLRPIHVFGYDSAKSLRDEVPLIRKLFDFRSGKRLLSGALRRIHLLERRLGHMIAFVCRRW